MAPDLTSFRPAYIRLQEDLERLSRAFQPSYLSYYEQMERALEPVRRHHLEIARAMELSGLATSRIAEVARATQRWQDLIAQPNASTRLFEDLTRTHQTWLNNVKPMQDIIAQLQAETMLSVGDLAYRLTVTERLFAGIDFEAMRRAVALPEPAFMRIEAVIGNVSWSYGGLAESIRTLPEIAQLPTFALTGATREVFTSAHALDALYSRGAARRERDPSEVDLIADAERETAGCIGLLQSVDPALVQPYIGAYEALRGGNTDRARHILASLRELWNHLLRRLAPDEHVVAWVPREDRSLLNEGQPTRRARVLYICRTLNHDPLTEFVVADTRALVKLVDFFNRVHDLKPEFTDEELRAILLRTDSWLTYILQIWEGAR